MLSVYVSLPVWPVGLNSTQYNLTRAKVINKQVTRWGEVEEEGCSTRHFKANRQYCVRFSHKYLYFSSLLFIYFILREIINGGNHARYYYYLIIFVFVEI